MLLFLNVLVSNVWLPKGEKRKMKWGSRGGEGTGPLNPLEVTLTWGGGIYCSGDTCSNNDCGLLCLYLCDQKQQLEQIPQYLGDRVLFTRPSSCKMHVSCSRKMYAAACHAGCGVGVAAAVLRAETDRSLWEASPWRLQAFSQLRSSENSYVGQSLPSSAGIA